MEAVEINPAILEAVLVEKEKFSPHIVKQIIKWNQQLEPSVNMTQSIISSYLLPNHNNQPNSNSHDQIDQKNETQTKPKNTSLVQQQNQKFYRLQKAVQDIPKTIKSLQQYKCPKSFLRAYLLFIKKNMQKISHLIKRQHILDSWVNVFPELLQNYFDTFNIKIEKYSIVDKNQDITNAEKLLIIKSEDFDKKIFELIQKKQYPNCMTLIKLSNCQKHHINKLFEKMTNNKEASKAADYVKSLKLNPLDYPALGQRLYKNTARHFLSKNGWEYAQEIFGAHPQALACIIEDLIFKKKFQEALSVWYRNECCRNFIVKQEAVLFLKPYVQSKGEMIEIDKIIQNFLHKDDFGPSNRNKFFSLEDFAFKEEHVLWIDQQTTSINECLEQLLNSQVLGIDTESIVGQTKFDKSQHSKFQEAATIQIATRSKIYVIDGFTAKHIPQIKETIIKYIRNNGLIIGHTLENDIDCMLKSLGCSDEQIKDLKAIKVVDVCKLFKAVYPKHRYSNLAFITQQMLGKQLCKIQTLTNWQLRPLRRNQLHYAAMDTLIVIKIYDKFIEQIGEQMIEYYCSIQEL